MDKLPKFGYIPCIPWLAVFPNRNITVTFFHKAWGAIFGRINGFIIINSRRSFSTAVFLYFVPFQQKGV